MSSDYRTRRGKGKMFAEWLTTAFILRDALGMLKSRMFGRAQSIVPIISNFGVFHDTLLVFETITRFASRH